MSSHISIGIHYVWSTKYRKPVISPDWEDRLYAYIGRFLAKEERPPEYK